MPRLASYIAGGAVFLLALDWAGVSLSTVQSGSSNTVNLVQTQTIVSREGKGDRLDRTINAAQTTVIGKSAISKSAGTDAVRAPVNGTAASMGDTVRRPTQVRDSHIPDGCDGAFSRLASVKNNFTARCIS